jgi:hypothetical protein
MGDLVDHPTLGQGERAAEQTLVQRTDSARVEAREAAYRLDVLKLFGQ